MGFNESGGKKYQSSANLIVSLLRFNQHKNKARFQKPGRSNKKYFSLTAMYVDEKVGRRDHAS